MGGDYYERDEEEESKEKQSFNAKSLNQCTDPRRFQDSDLVCHNPVPIVFAFDVSASMAEWPQVT